MKEDEQESTDVVFLLGAGASVDANIPDTYKFVSEFEKYIKTGYPQLERFLTEIIETLKKVDTRVDVELLLRALNSLKTKETDILLKFYEEAACHIKCDNKQITELETELQNFIRDRVVVKEQEKLEYLKEILKFDTPIEIFSTNYDTCIEQISHEAFMTYTDGFDVYWNVKNFSENYEIKHYKMHGSVTWYEDEHTKECVKIPVVASQDGKPVKLKLIYGENVKPLVIYPAQKAEYIEPLTDLQLKFKNKLMNNSTKLLIAVGYSFRDDYIVHMLWDAARTNEDLHVILISPNAQEVFENKLKYIDREKKIPSRLNDRVICLPYPFSTIIHDLKNKYTRGVKSIISMEKDSKESERSGGKIEWSILIKAAIENEFTEKADSLFKTYYTDWKEIGVQKTELLRLTFEAMLHSVICRDGTENDWISKVNDILASEIDLEEINLVRGRVTSYFGIGGYAPENMNNFLSSWVDPMIKAFSKKENLLTLIFLNSLKPINSSIEKLKDFYKICQQMAKGIDVSAEQSTDSNDTKALLKEYSKITDEAVTRGSWISPQPDKIMVEIQRQRLKDMFGRSLQFKLDS